MEVLEIPGYPVGLLEHLNALRLKGLMCDTTIGYQGGTLPAHRLILEAACPYFQQRVRKLDTGDFYVDLDNFEEQFVLNIVEYLYTGKLKVSSETFENVIKICEELQLTSALEACQSYLKVGEKKQEEINKGKVDEVASAEVINEPPVKRKRKAASRQTKDDSKNEIQKAAEKEKPRRTRKAVNPKRTKPTVKKKVERKATTKANSAAVIGEELLAAPSKDGSTQVADKKTATVDPEKEYSVLVEFETGEPKIVTENVPANDDNGEDYENMNDDDSDTDSDEDVTDDNDDVSESVDIKRIDENGRVIKKTVRKKTRGKAAEGKTKKKRRRKPFPCSVCPKVLTSKKRQIFHEYCKHGTPIDFKSITFTVSPCKVQGCNYIAADPRSLDVHMKSRHGNARPHVCEFCGKAFKLPNILEIHLNIHTGTKSWKCDHCGESFNQQSGLQMHNKRYHMGESSWTEMCHMCSEKFLQKADLAWHLFKAHGQPLPDNYKMYVCDICGFSTMKSQQLKQHRERHDGIKNFICSICSKACSTKSELRRHVSFHGEKKHKCTFEGCSYACTDSIGLEKHIKLMHTHKDFKPYACPVCQYRTGVKGNVDKHIRTVHDLIVVTKHTVNLKMKYSNFESGDVITKDGHLIATAKERKALQQVPTIDKEIGQETQMSANVNDLTYADFKLKESADITYLSIKKSKRQKSNSIDEQELDETDDPKRFLNSDLTKNSLSGVISDQTEPSKMETIIHDLPPLSNYVYIHGDIGMAQDLRLTGINGSDPNSLYNVGSSEMFNLQQKY